MIMINSLNDMFFSIPSLNYICIDNTENINLVKGKIYKIEVFSSMFNSNDELETLVGIDPLPDPLPESFQYRLYKFKNFMKVITTDS